MPDRNDWNRQTVEAFRANEGKVGGMWEGRPLLLLTTTGAKSGQRRTSPMMYKRDGDHLLVFASKGGAPTNPDWYHNLLAHPEVTVEVGNESYDAIATPVTGEERDRSDCAVTLRPRIHFVSTAGYLQLAKNETHPHKWYILLSANKFCRLNTFT